MVKDIGTETIEVKLNEVRSNDPLTEEEEAQEAIRNLGEFIWLLYKINEREGIIPMEELKAASKQPVMDKPAT